MLIQFKGKGCRECPFFLNHHLGCYCWLNHKKAVGESGPKIKIDFMDVDIDEEEIGDWKHENCPFVDGKDVTIVAKNRS